ncbi:MAG: SIS domain-containing protein [Armatimonadetes bacterium]|nr:SIS domain-containing protein [Armatimonadota bacterium]
MNTEQPIPVLDDVARVQAVDKRNVLRLINELPEQCETALGIGRSFVADPLPEPPNVIYISGTGEAGIAADMAVQAVDEFLEVPILSDHGGRLPKSVGEASLVIVLDYPGNSAPTLRLYKEARLRGARVICITSGGKLREAASKDGTRIVRIPPGQPSRSAIGYLFIPAVMLFEQFGLASGLGEKLSYGIRLMKNVREAIRFENATARNIAKQIAHASFGKTTIIYGAPDYRSTIAARWKSQVNANAKSLAFASSFPDAAESDISGWELASKKKEVFTLVFLKDSADRSEIAAMMSASQEVLREFDIIEAEMKGASTMEKLLYGVYLADYVSYYMALLAEVNPAITDYVSQVQSRLAGETPPEEETA